MEWTDFHYSPLMEEESFYGLIPSTQKPEWTSDENKLFEKALAEIDPSSPAFFEDVASRVPWKSVEDIRNHYQALVEDVDMIESGRFPVPDYRNIDHHQEKREEKKNIEVSSPPLEAKTRNGQQRRRGVPWTEEEHQLFLMGLNKYGKGDWRSISRYYVITKTPTQVASHAQKYFRRQTSSTPVDRRRPSIHDIQTVNFNPSSTAVAAPRHGNIDETVLIPFSSNRAFNIPILNHGFNGEQSPIFLPTDHRFPSGDDGISSGQTSGGNYSAAHLLPSLRNQQQQWG